MVIFQLKLVLLFLGRNPPDFAVTSGLRLESIADSARDPDAALTKYEDFKCQHQETKTQCSAQGITFIPMVMEAVGGGWGKVARSVWSQLAKSSALASGELQTESSSAIIIPRACLKRFAS